MTRVAYELSGRPAALVVDLAAAAAGWRVGDREAEVGDVLALAPRDEVARLIRHALAEIRAHAASDGRVGRGPAAARGGGLARLPPRRSTASASSPACSAVTDPVAVPRSRTNLDWHAVDGIEGLGVLYVGRPYDLATQTPQDAPLLYDSKDLVTHAVCVGMTGSGKTGLCLALIEEAALDGIPAVIVDPKGDLGNLLLTFPDLQPEDFRPWIDEAEAAAGRRHARRVRRPDRRAAGRRASPSGARTARASAG